MQIGNKKVEVEHLIIPTVKWIELIWGVFTLLLILLPIYPFTNNLFPNQVELLYISIILLSIWSLLIIACTLLHYPAFNLCPTSYDWVFYIFLVYLFLRAGARTTANNEFVMQLYASALAYFCFKQIPSLRVPLFAYAIICAGIIQIVYSLFVQGEYLLLYEKLGTAHGSFMNTSVWGGFLALQIILVIGLLSITSSLKARLLLSIIAMCFIILIVLSHSRAGWLAFVCGFAYLAYKIRLNKTAILYKHHFLILFLSIVVLVLLCTFLYAYKKDSANGRLLIWRVSYEMIKDKPFFGHGVEGFRYNYMQYQGKYYQHNPEQSSYILADNTEFAFNEYIKFVVEHGVIGLCAFMVLFLKLLSRKTDPSTYYLTLSRAGVVSWSVFAFFSYPFFLWQFTILFLFLLSIDNANKKQKLLLPAHIKYAICLLYIVVNIGIFIAFIPYRQAILKWNNTTYNERSAEKRSKLMQKLYPTLKSNSDFLLDYGRTMQNIKCFDEAENLLRQSYLLYPHYDTALSLGEVLVEKRNIIDATHYLQTAAYMIPNRILPHYYLFRLYRDNGYTKKAHNKMKEIRAMQVKIYFPEMNFITKELEQFAAQTACASWNIGTDTLIVR